MVLSFIGACLLWVGWFGFNAGSALNSGSLATSAFVNTHFAAAAAALGWTVAEWIHNGKPTALGAISGAVAGLVAITPASGFVQPMSALVIGLVAGIFCSFMVFEVKSRLGYDDSLDAFGVHGAGGTLGRAADRHLRRQLHQCRLRRRRLRKAAPHRRPRRPLGTDWQPGRRRSPSPGSSRWSAPWCLLFVVDKLIGLRVSPEHEQAGLDLSQHGEEGYDFNT